MFEGPQMGSLLFKKIYFEHPGCSCLLNNIHNCSSSCNSNNSNSLSNHNSCNHSSLGFNVDLLHSF